MSKEGWTCFTSNSSDSGPISGNDPRFSHFVEQLKEIEYPKELLDLLEEQYLRYGSKIRLLTRSNYAKSNLRSNRRSSIIANNEAYIGIYEKPDGTKRLVVPPIGDICPGKLKEMTVTVNDPYGEKSNEDLVLYGDIISLTTENGEVWSFRNLKGVADGYITPSMMEDNSLSNIKPMVLSFQKTGKVHEPIVFGEPGVTIRVEENENSRTNFSGNLLSNYKNSKSKVLGGYICCNNYGNDIIVSITEETGSSSMAASDDSQNEIPENVSNMSSFPSMRALSRASSISGLFPSFQSQNVEKDDRDSVSKRHYYFRKNIMILVLSYLLMLFVVPFFIRECIYIIVVEGYIVSNPTLDSLFQLKHCSQNESVPLRNSSEWICPSKISMLFEVSLFNIMFSIISCYSFGLLTPKSMLRKRQRKTKEKITEPDYLSSDDFVEVSAENLDENDELQYDPEQDRIWRTFGKDEQGVPKHPAFKRFLDGEFGNMAVALKRWEVTCDWRESNNVDSILRRPHEHFKFIKENYAHFYVGRSIAGYPVYLERPGDSNLKRVFSKGLSVDDLLYHYVYLTEYAWKVIEKEGSETARFISIVDMTGVRFKDIFGDSLKFLKSAVSLTGSHYPETSYKIFIINIPSWFNAGFKLVKPFVAEETLKKIRIYRHGFEKELLTLISSDVLPKKYGGTETGEEYELPLEKQLWNYVENVNNKNST